MSGSSSNDKSYVAIRSSAYHVPKRVLGNRELAKMIDTSDEWIVSHTGIRQRYIADSGEAASDLAIEAAKGALDNGGVVPEQIDLIVLATSTPDYLGFPATACVLQDKLGCHNAAAFDITAACSGFLYALEIARSMLLANPSYHKALVVGAEVLSQIVDWQDRSTCVLFGDGAGAALLTRQDTEAESGVRILDTVLKTDGSGAAKLWIPEGGSRRPNSGSAAQGEKSRKFIEMDGRTVYNFAVAVNQKIIHEMLQRNQLDLRELRYIVPHQANLRIIQAVAKREKIPMELFFTNIDRYANTSAASIPIALSELTQRGELRCGDLILCIGFGSGLTYAGALLRWG